MNILYVAPRYHTNQVPIMKGWQERNCHVMFMAEFEGVSEIHDYVDFVRMEPSWITKILFAVIDKKYEPIQAEGKRIVWFIPAFFKTLRKIKTFRPDLVIMRERYITNFVVYFICLILGIQKCILYVQQPVYGNEEGEDSVKKRLKGILFPKVVFSPVYYIGEKRGKIGHSNTWFVPLIAENVGLENNIQKVYFENDTIRFLDIGKYREYKNHFFLIDVFAALKKRVNGLNARLTIIGQLSNREEEEYYKRLNAYIKEKGLEDIVETRKNIPFREMEKLYSEHDVLLLPSTYESAGMVILEAMEKGLCVVASIYCGLSSYLEEFQCGYTFDIKETMALENILMDLMDNKELICETGSRGSAVIQNELCFENYLHALNQLTEEEFNFSIINSL